MQKQTRNELNNTHLLLSMVNNNLFVVVQHAAKCRTCFVCIQSCTWCDLYRLVCNAELLLSVIDSYRSCMVKKVCIETAESLFYVRYIHFIALAMLLDLTRNSGQRPA